MSVFRPRYGRGLGRGNLRAQQSLAILVLCLRKTRAGKSHGYCDFILFEKLLFKMFSVHWKKQSGCLQIPPVEIVFKKLHFRIGLVWTVFVTVFVTV